MKETSFVNFSKTVFLLEINDKLSLTTLRYKTLLKIG